MSAFSVIVLAVTLALCGYAFWASHRAIQCAREDWIRSGPHDHQAIASMMSRVGWLERKRLAKALKQ